MNHNDKILVLGGTGLVGSAITKRLMERGYENVLSIGSRECDLRDKEQTVKIYKSFEPDYVFLTAARVGGILANKKYKGQMIYDNLMIQTNAIHYAKQFVVRKFLFLGSSCIYPRDALQPIKEEYFMTGALEETNNAYAVAKIAGIQMCQAYKEQYGFNAISLMPTNIYGPRDNFHPVNAHVLPALIHKFHQAKVNGDSTVTCWGDGSPMREFLYVDDLADACICLMQNYNNSDIINVGTGKDISIKILADIIADVVGYNGKILWDTSALNGTPRKLLNVDKINSLGWQAKVGLHEGIATTYKWYLEQRALEQQKG